MRSLLNEKTDELLVKLGFGPEHPEREALLKILADVYDHGLRSGKILMSSELLRLAEKQLLSLSE